MKKSIVTLALLATMSISALPMVTFAQYGGGGGPPVGLMSIINNNSGGKVLGASTSNIVTSVTPANPITCTALLTSYMRYGSKHNDPVQVTRLQTFLAQHGYNVPIDGFFGLSTFNAVKLFQKDHQDDVLAPWGINVATGYVYKMTLWTINKMECPRLNEPFPKLF